MSHKQFRLGRCVLACDKCGATLRTPMRNYRDAWRWATRKGTWGHIHPGQDMCFGCFVEHHMKPLAKAARESAERIAVDHAARFMDQGQEFPGAPCSPPAGFVSGPPLRTEPPS